MNILILASTFPRWPNDTVPHFVLDFAKSISKSHHITVLAPYEKGSKLHEHLDNIEVFRFPYFLPGLEKLAYRGGMINAFRESFLAKLQLPLFLLFELLWTLFLAKKKKIDVINAHWLIPQGFVAWVANKIIRKPLIITTHGGDIAVLQNKKIAKLLGVIVKKSSSVTFVSVIARNRALSALQLKQQKKFAVMPMGITLPNQPKTTVQNGIKIAFIGRLVAIKGVDYLIKAFAKVVKSHSDVQLNILGDGPLMTDLERLTKELHVDNKVSFEGFVSGSKKDSLISNASIVVVPSIRDEHGYEEGLPVAALEAMAYQKALIATSTGSLPALIDNDQNGLLVEPSDVNALALALDRLIRDYEFRESLAHNGRQTANEYSWEAVAAKFNSITEGISRAK